MASVSLNFATSDYFSMLLHADKRSHAALEMLVDDLHADKERTIGKFLCHSGSEDFLWGLVKLLGNQNSRYASIIILNVIYNDSINTNYNEA